jgi:hypothetical protein
MALKQIDHGSKEYGQMIAFANGDIAQTPWGFPFSDEELAVKKKIS